MECSEFRNSFERGGGEEKIKKNLNTYSAINDYSSFDCYTECLDLKKKKIYCRNNLKRIKSTSYVAT